MKKEKQIRSYQRRTKSGKLITVKAHTAKYDAAEKAMEAAKKKGAGEELERRKMPSDDWRGLSLSQEMDIRDAVKASKEPSEPAFTAVEFKEWYRGTGSAADKKVEKALKKQLGRAGYRKLEDEAIDNYSSRGHLAMFKRIAPEQYSKEKSEKPPTKSNNSATIGKTKTSTKPTFETSISEAFSKLDGGPDKYVGMGSYQSRVKGGKITTSVGDNGQYIVKVPGMLYGKGKEIEPKMDEIAAKHGLARKTKPSVGSSYSTYTFWPKESKNSKEANWRKSSDISLRKKGDKATGQMNVGKRTIDLEVTPTNRGYEVSLYDRKGNIGWLANMHLTTLSDLSKHVKNEVAPKRRLTSKLMDSGEIEYGTEKVISKKLKSQIL